MSILKEKKATLGLIFMLVIALVLTPMVSFGNDGEFKAIGPYVGLEDDGKTADFDNTSEDSLVRVDKDPNSEDNTWVEHSKKIKEVSDGKYQIDLKVQTNEVRKEVTGSAVNPTDVVIIMDVSGSMTSNNVTYNGDSVSRWVAARESMITFIEEFMTGANAVEGNRVAIGSFSGGTSGGNFNDHNINVCEWTTSAAVAKASIDGKTNSNLRRTNQGSWTNMQAGFMAADEILTKASVETSADYSKNDKVVIFVGDGNPTCRYNGTGGTVGTGSYAAAHADAAKAQIDTFKTAYPDSLLFTLGIGNATEMERVLKYRLDEKGKGVDKFFTAMTGDEIEQVFLEIKDIITYGVQVWTVTDPMSKWVNFEGFVDGSSDGKSSDGTAGISGGAINWNLEAVNATESGGIYTYTLSYYVSLNKNAAGFEYDTYYPTNEKTWLDYAFKETVNGNVVNGTLTESEFYIPTLKAKDDRPREDVKISKNVTGTTDRSQEFTFTVKINNEAYQGDYYVGDSKKTADKNGNIVLKGDQTAIIKDVLVGATVDVVEADGVYPYTVSGKAERDLKVTKDGDNTIAYTNEYKKPTEVEGIKTSDIDTKTPVWRGQEIEYTIEIVNNDTTTATGVIVKDYAPEHTTIVDVDNGTKGESNGKEYAAWYIDEIGPNGDSAKVSFTVKIGDNFDLGMKIVNQGLFEITGEEDPEEYDNDPSNKTNEVTHYPPAEKMEIVKSSNPENGADVKRGDVIEYKLTVNNLNNGAPDLKKVVVRDYIPAGTTYEDGSATDGGSYNDSGKFVEWTLENITKSAEVSFKVKVNEDAVNGQLINNVALAVIADGEELPGEDSWTPSNEVEHKVVVEEVKAEVLPEVADPEDDQVLGETAEDPIEEEEPTVLGEEAKTGDTMTSLPYLLIMLGAAIAVMALVLVRMTRKED